MEDGGPTATFELPLRLPGFLSVDECRELVAEIDAAPQEQVQVWQDNAWSTRSDSRRGAIAQLREETEILVHDRLWQVIPELEQCYGCEVSHLSGVTALIYGEGDRFATHADGGYDDDAPPEVRRRRVSLVVALNDGCATPPDFDGGELHLYPSFDPDQVVQVRSRPGLLVAFQSAMLHQVTPVARGRRYSLALWALASAD